MDIFMQYGIFSYTILHFIQTHQFINYLFRKSRPFRRILRITNLTLVIRCLAIRQIGKRIIEKGRVTSASGWITCNCATIAHRRT